MISCWRRGPGIGIMYFHGIIIVPRSVHLWDVIPVVTEDILCPQADPIWHKNHHALIPIEVITWLPEVKEDFIDDILPHLSQLMDIKFFWFVHCGILWACYDVAEIFVWSSVHVEILTVSFSSTVFAWMTDRPESDTLKHSLEKKFFVCWCWT